MSALTHREPTYSARQRLVTALGAVALFALCFTLLSMMRENIRFMDEMDNFSIGLQMTKGGVLYVSLFSQHMPLMYYLCALFARLGAHSVLSFRLYWYVFLSLCYVAVYLRYQKWYGRTALWLWPVLYLAALPTTALCTSILAEQLQAVGMVVLLLEFLHFAKTREVSAASAVCIAVGVNIAFLSAFVSAFAIAGIVLGFVVAEVAFCVRQKHGFGAAVAYLWKKYRLTIGLTLAPMALFALWFAINGMWGDFWYKAITFNTQVYSEYQNGFGASGLGAVLGCFTKYIDWLKTAFQTLFQGAAKVPAAVLVLAAAQYAFLLCLLCTRRVYAAVVTEVFFLLCGSRGFYNYHSLQCFALSALMLALLCGGLWRCARGGAPTRCRSKRLTPKLARRLERTGEWQRFSQRLGLDPSELVGSAAHGPTAVFIIAKPGKGLRLLCGAAFAVLLLGYGALCGTFFWQHRTSVYPTARELSPEYDAHSHEALLNALTDDGEYILQNINREDLFLETHVRAPSYNTAPSPWWWAATRTESMAAIQADPPRVAIYDPQYTAFGEYVVEDFAPELDAFVRKNYTLLYHDAPDFYVRNDYLDEARAKLPADDSDMVGATTPNTTCGDALLRGPVKQHFTATRSEIKTLSVQFGTHSRPFTGSVTATLTADATGETLATWQVQGSDITDNAFTFFQRETDNPVPLTVGEAYTLTLTAQWKDDTNLTVWAASGEADDIHYAETVDGRQSDLLRIKVR